MDRSISQVAAELNTGACFRGPMEGPFFLQSVWAIVCSARKGDRNLRDDRVPGRTIVPITEEIAVKCDLLDEMIEAFIAVRENVDAAHGRYEAPKEALNLFNLTIRHIEGVVTLAREDLVLLPPALIAARAAMETSIRAAWMMSPADPFEREVRWVAHIRTEEEFLRRQFQGSNSAYASSGTQEKYNSIRAFREAVTSLLEAKGYNCTLSVPNLRECLRSLGNERVYLIYPYLSQFAHGNHSSTWLYRSSGLGNAAEFGEYVGPDHWNVPLNVCLFVFDTPSVIVLRQLGTDSGNMRRIFAKMEREGHA